MHAHAVEWGGSPTAPHRGTMPAWLTPSATCMVHVTPSRMKDPVTSLQRGHGMKHDVVRRCEARWPREAVPSSRPQRRLPPPR